MKKNLKLTMLSIALLLICVIFISSINAYFTDGDTKTNTFTVGKVSLKLEEPNWEPPKDITPNQEIPKDPQITNDGVNDEFVFLIVAVPYSRIITAEDNGTRQEAEKKELFTYTINPGWTEITIDDINSYHADDNNGVNIHLYVYGTKEKCTSLTKGETTPPLFNSVKFCNAIEDQGLELTTKEIVISAVGIQTNNINGGKTAPIDVLEVLENQFE